MKISIPTVLSEDKQSKMRELRSKKNLSRAEYIFKLRKTPESNFDVSATQTSSVFLTLSGDEGLRKRYCNFLIVLTHRIKI